MPSTTNFGWTTPADTDLVKDGASAIRTLGNGIDTSFVDLKGGTTGQVLSKNSNTDLDFTWVAQDDSNAIQNALLTTTGDTIYASGASTPARLGIGTSGQVLTVSGGVPTWAAPASASAYTSLATGTVASAATGFDIQSISGSYVDLYLVVTGISHSAAGNTARLRINNDTGNNYKGSYAEPGSTATWTVFTSSSIGPSTTLGTTGTASFIFWFPAYSNSTSRKSGTYLSSGNQNSQTYWGIFDWANTGAINRLTLLTFSGNFTGGTYTVYGVK